MNDNKVVAEGETTLGLSSNRLSAAVPAVSGVNGRSIKVSSHDEPLVLVNANDEVLGSKPKLACHMGDGLLHRAFSLHVINSSGQVLLQRRAAEKLLWPGYWSNSCCSHPHFGESMEDAVHRRAYQELGLQVEVRYLYKFQYQAAFKELGAEHEMCSVFVGFTDDVPVVNPTEVAEWQYLGANEVTELLDRQSEQFTPWFHMEWSELSTSYPGLFKATQLKAG